MDSCEHPWQPASAVVSALGSADSTGQGLLDRQDFIRLLSALGQKDECKLQALLDASGSGCGQSVRYLNFVEWLFDCTLPPRISNDKAVEGNTTTISICLLKHQGHLTLHVLNTISVRELKEEIRFELSISPSQQLLFSHNQLLDESKTLQELGLENGSILYLTDFTPLRSSWASPFCPIPHTELRGITLEQLRTILKFIKAHTAETANAGAQCPSAWYDMHMTNSSSGSPLKYSSFNLYQANDWLIKPATLPYECSLVELMSGDPTAQACSWFVSHYWGEPIVDFVACIEEHARLRQLPANNAWWVCAYANNQHTLNTSQDLAENPYATSFFRAMQRSDGVLLLLDKEATPFRRTWCCFEQFVAVTHRRENGTRMLLDVAAFGSADRTQPVFITDGLVLSEERQEVRCPGIGWRMKAEREDLFPVDLVENQGLDIDIEKADASNTCDKIRILNCIAGASECNLNDPYPTGHPMYLQVSRTLRSFFAIATWRKAVQNSLHKFCCLLAQTLQEDATRKLLQLTFSGLGRAVSDEHLEILGSGLSPTLEDLHLSFEGCQQISDAGLAGLSTGLARLTRLVVLRLNFGGCVELRDVSKLAASMSVSQTLETVNLNFSGCKELTCAQALGACLTGPAIGNVELNFARSGLLSCCLMAPCSEQQLERVRSLNLRFSRCSSLTDIESFSHLFGCCSQLQHLRLSLYDCSNTQNFESLFEGLGKLSSLKSLEFDLSFCTKLADVETLSKALSNLKGFERLHLTLKGCSFLPQSLQGEFFSPIDFYEACAPCALGRKVPFRPVLKELMLKIPMKH